MTTEPRDDVALPHFEDRLWDELAELHTHRRTSPAAPTAPAALRRRRTRRTRRIVAVAATGIAAAATLVAGLGVLPGSEPEPAEASLAERIISATEDAVTDSVVHTAQDNASTGVNDQENWIDVTSGWFRTLLLHADGTPVFESGQPRPPDPDDRAPTGEPPEEPSCTVQPPPDGGDDGGDTVQVEPEPCPLPDRDTVDYPTLDTRMVNYCTETYHDGWQAWTRDDLYDSPQQIGERLAAGELVRDGTETVDGRELIRLRDVVVAGLPDDFAVDQFYLVDPDTYRPVQVYGDRGGPEEFTMAFEYLPRTQENLALLAVQVPDGFTETDEPPIMTGPTC